MQVVLSLIVALVAALLGPKFLGPYLPASLQPHAPVAEKPAQESGETEVKETVYQKILNRGTIQCGYYTWAPFLMKDANTGQLSGISYDVMEAIGKFLNLKIEWTTEIGAGEIATALNANKFDLMCVTVWPGSVTRLLTHTNASYYSSVFAFVRADDTRFDNSDLNNINAPDVIVAAGDGDVSLDIARNSYPQAKTYAITQMEDAAMQLEAVATKKADVAFADIGFGLKYMASNPNKIKQVVSAQPVAVFGEHYVMKMGEFDFKNILDTAIDHLNNTGELAAILKRYSTSTYPVIKFYDAVWRVANPMTPDVPAPADAKETAPAAEPAKATEPAPAQPSDAALEKPAEAAPAVAPEKPAEKAPDAKAEPKAEETSEAPALQTPEVTAPAKTDAAKEADTKATEEKAEPKAEPKKEAAKPAPAAPPAPTLGDVKDALDKARAAAAAKAAESPNLPPGVTAPQPLTGAEAARNIISPSLPENTISPTTEQ